MTKWSIISPHCDDVESGMGGYISRAKAENPDLEISVLIMSVSPTHSNASGKLVTPEERIKEQEQAAEFLDYQVSFGFLEENSLLDISRGILINDIEKFINSTQPDELFIPLVSFNQDHQAVHDACITATRPTSGKFNPIEIWMYEYPGNCWGARTPDTGKYYVRLSKDNLRDKLQALACHQSQVQGKDEDLFGTRGVINLASQRGSECEHEYAELYYLLKWVY